VVALILDAVNALAAPAAPATVSPNSGYQHQRRASVALQRKLLGRPSSKEWDAALMVIFLVAGFLTGSLHHIPPVSIAPVALVLLGVFGVIPAALWNRGNAPSHRVIATWWRTVSLSC
jgi:hypothetical protein